MWLHGWAIVAGVVAAGVPVIIHWLTRPRPLRLPLSTLRFVREAVQQRRTTHRLRDALVLTLRVAAVLLIAAALARPMIGRQDEAVTSDDAAVARVVIVDASHSLAAQSHGVRLFDVAQSVAARELEYRPGLKCNLILAGARPRSVFPVLSSNFATLKDELARAAPRPEALNVVALLNAASEMLASVGTDWRREVVIVSDFQRTNWATADFAVLPKDTLIRLESVAPREPASNLAVLNVSTQGRIEVGRPVRLQVEIGNYSPTSRQVRVDLRFGRAASRGGAAATGLYSSYRLEGTCLPYAKTTLSEDVVPSELGWLVGEATLTEVGTDRAVSDALPEDNVRSCVWDVRPAPAYVLITRQSEQQRPSSSYFLERALAPADVASRNASRWRRLDPARVDAESIGAAELIVIDHPGLLAVAAVNELAALLRRGRGVLYVAAESSDATNLKRLTEALGSGLQMPVEFAPAATGPTRQALFVADVRREVSPFDVFGDQLTPLVKDLRFSGGLNSHAIDGALQDDILATLSDRSALLVATSSDAGTLAVLNADLGQSNLASSPLFVPMLSELVQRQLLCGRRAAHDVVSGEPAMMDLPNEVDSGAGLTLSGPDSAQEKFGELSAEPTGVVWHTDAAGPPGLYSVHRGGEAVFAVASVLPAAESDLRTLSADVFQERLAGGRDVRFRAALSEPGDSRDTLWTWLALGCALCLLSELVVLRIFRM